MFDDSTIKTTHWQQSYYLRYLASEQAPFNNDKLNHIPKEQVGHAENASVSSNFEVQ
jgi:hypothetical protein